MPNGTYGGVLCELPFYANFSLQMSAFNRYIQQEVRIKWKFA